MFVNFTFIGLMAPVFTIFNTDLYLMDVEGEVEGPNPFLNWRRRWVLTQSKISSVNTKRIPSYGKYLSESGINGVLVAATSGEGTSLSLQERKNLVEAWAAAVKDTKQHLMVQVGGAPFPDVIDLARHADALGVDSILTMPELYFKPKTSQELISYLKFVSAAAPSTPLLYYHNPGHTGVEIDMAEFLEQASGQIPNLRGIKYTSNNLAGAYAALKAAEEKYTVFIGGDYLLEPAFAIGFNSAIATSMNVFPRYSIGMLEAVKKSKIDLARELQQNLTTIVNTVAKYGSKVSGMKLVMNLFTPINVGLARPPLQNPSSSKIQEVKKLIEPLL